MLEKQDTFFFFFLFLCASSPCSSPLRPPPDEPPGFFPCILPSLPPPLSRSPRVSGPLPGGGARGEAACCPRPGSAAAAPVLPGLERWKAQLLTAAAAALAPFLLLLLRPPLASSSGSGCANHRGSSRRPPPPRRPRTPAAAIARFPSPAGRACPRLPGLHPRPGPRSPLLAPAAPLFAARAPLGRREGNRLGAPRAALRPKRGGSRCPEDWREGVSLRRKEGGAPERGRRCPAPRWRCGARGAAADAEWYCRRNWGPRDGVQGRPRGAATWCSGIGALDWRGGAVSRKREKTEDPGRGWRALFPSAPVSLGTDVALWGLGKCQRSEPLEASAACGLCSCSTEPFSVNNPRPKGKKGIEAVQRGSSVNPWRAAQIISRPQPWCLGSCTVAATPAEGLV